MAEMYKKIPCPSCREQGNDKTGDNLVIYSDGGEHCFSCNYTKSSEEYLVANGLIKEIYREEWMGEFNQDEWDRLKEVTSNDPKGFRGLDKETCVRYGVRHSFDEVSGAVTKQYYPLTKNNVDMCGYKWRVVLPKKAFSSCGTNKAEDGVQLFGQASFTSTRSRSVFLAAGEVDALSAYKIFKDYNKTKDSNFDVMPIVSATTGEGSKRQIQMQYDFFNSFEKIYICPDKDNAGEKALEAIAKILPKDKIFVVDLPLKDINEMLTAGKQADFINRYFKARAYSPSGIKGSDTLYDDILESLDIPKLTLPDFMSDVQHMFGGGITVPSIVNIVAPSGVGKSTIVNEMVYYWIYNSPYKIGILSLEADSSDYGKVLASRHLSRKLSLIESVDEAKEYLQKDDIKVKLLNLFKNDDGTPRFWLMDERDGKIERIKQLIEKLIISCDCKVIIIDPIQDLFAGLSIAEQEEFIAWLKVIIKAYGIIFICINHIRKQMAQKDNAYNPYYNESEIMGTSSLIKSSFFTILLNRNKYLDHKDPNSNRISVMVSKNRITGVTGPSDDLYYDNSTHTLYNFEKYKNMFPEKFQQVDESDKY